MLLTQRRGGVFGAKSISSLLLLLLVCIGEQKNGFAVALLVEDECIIGSDGTEICGGDGGNACEDTLGESRCASMARRDGCIKSFDTMRDNCAKTCHVCDEDAVAVQELEQAAEDDTFAFDRIFSQDVPQIISGQERVETFRRLQDVEEYMYNTVYHDQEFQKVRVACQNRHELCTFWAMLGECEKNPAYMKKDCAPSCFSCEGLDFEKRCPFDKDAPVALNPGDLDKMFQRIMTHPELAQYTPKAIMKPRELIADDDDSDAKNGPWIVVLENFLSDEECETLIQLGADKGYELSLDVGEATFDGSYGAKESKDRTSSNAWCTEECWEHNVTQTVHDRLEFLTGIDRMNYEYLQLLRYEPGQFYGDHHDYIEHHVERVQGPRTLTVFLYLNDVEEGGGTHFGRLDQTVMPKRGRALIWPSVLNESPNKKDTRTHHQALPVEAGIKYGANAWLHQRDFKTPWKAGCH